MKKLILIAAMAQLVLLAGCRKDLIDYLSGGSGSKKYDVSFRIGGLNHTIGESNVGFQTEPVKNYITQLTIIVYEAQSGAEVIRKTQSATDLDFGQVTFQLPPANYRFIAAGSNTPFGINLFYQTPTTVPVTLPYSEAYMQYLQADWAEGEKRYKTTDTFLAKTTTKITGNKTIDMIMKRIIGQVEISFSDAPTFALELFRESTAFLFDSESPTLGVVFRPHFEVNTTTNGPLKLNILKTTDSIFVDIYRIGVIPRTIKIPVRKNKITKVTGKVLTEEYTITIQ